MLRLIVGLCLALGFTERECEAQSGTTLERIAALKFAVASGLTIPQGAVVAIETIADSTGPRAPATRIESRQSDAALLAAVLSPGTRAVSVANLVTCRRHICWAETNTPVLVASDPEVAPRGTTIVGITVKFKDSAGAPRIAGGAIEVDKVADGWVGGRFSVGPYKKMVRIPPH